MEVVQEIAYIHERLVQKFEEAGISFKLPTVIDEEEICVGIYSNLLNAECTADVLRGRKIDPHIHRVRYDLDWLPEACYIGVKRKDIQKAMDCILTQSIAFTDLEITQVLEKAKFFRRRTEKFFMFLAKIFIGSFGLLSVYLIYKSFQQGKLESILIFGVFFLFNIILWFLLRKESTVNKGES